MLLYIQGMLVNICHGQNAYTEVLMDKTDRTLLLDAYQLTFMCIGLRSQKKHTGGGGGDVGLQARCYCKSG